MRRGTRWLLNLAAFVAGFACFAAVISAVMPPLRVSHISLKLDWLAARPADYDVLVVGSSRMRQIVPSVLDAEMTAGGMPVRSFNLSADGMRPPEDSYVLDRALASRKAPLKFIFMEANPIALRIDPEDEGTDRMIHWHDTERMLTIWHRAFAHSIEDPPWLGKWLSDTWRNARFAAHHTKYWVWNSVHLGRGPELLHKHLRLPAAPKWEIGLGPRNDGYIPPDDGGPMPQGEAEGYSVALRKKLRVGADVDVMDGASQAQVQHAARLAQRFGARLVIIAPPSTTVKTFRPILSPETGAIFIDLSDPTRHPELFDAPIRLDGNHLTEEGSILFTRAVARLLAASLPAGVGVGVRAD